MKKMAFKTKKLLSKRANYGTKRDTKVIKFLVYHYTANDGDTAMNNAKYFHDKVVKGFYGLTVFVFLWYTFKYRN